MMYFKHKYTPDPGITPSGAIVQATKKLKNALKGFRTPLLTQASAAQLLVLGDIFSTQPSKHDIPSQPSPRENK